MVSVTVNYETGDARLSKNMNEKCLSAHSFTHSFTCFNHGPMLSMLNSKSLCSRGWP